MSVFALQLWAANGVRAPAAHQCHVAAGADGSELRCHDVSLSLCHFQLPAGKLDGVLSMADLGEHAAALRPQKPAKHELTKNNKDIKYNFCSLFSRRGFFLPKS